MDGAPYSQDMKEAHKKEKAKKLDLREKKFHDFQFMVHYEWLIEANKQIQDLYNDMKSVPDELIEEFDEKKMEGFVNWGPREFQRFMVSFSAR